MRKLRTLAVLIAALCCSVASAYDFEVDGIYYNKLSSTTVEVADCPDKITGDVTIPETVTYEGSTYSVTSIGESAFDGCSSLTSISIPNSVTSIGNGAFFNCFELKGITIPNSVTSIGGRAFSHCEELQEITILSTVTSIGDGAFEGCYGLKEITILSTVMSIGGAAFDAFDDTAWWESQAEGVVYLGCMLYRYKGVMPSETSIDVKEGTTSIGDHAFSGSELKEITIPNSVTSIGDYAFKDCRGLEEITIPSSVTSIGEGVFADCSELKEITIPNSVTSIGDYAFSKCSSLKEISIPNSVTSIGARAFYHCDSLAEVIISESITKIGDEAFMYCSNIKKIVCNATTPPTCYYDTFTGINKEECVLMVPEGTVALYKEAKRWKDFFFVESIPSAIEQVASPSDSTGDIYDLNGRLVRTQAEGVDGLMPGIYIKNGNKFVVK